MRLSDATSRIVRERLEEAKSKYPAALSPDGEALMVAGGIGYAAYLAPDGDAYFETYDLSDVDVTKYDRSVGGQLMVLVLGSRRIPELRSLIPVRPDSVSDCDMCSGEGWKTFGPTRLICESCSGLGRDWPEDLSL